MLECIRTSVVLALFCPCIIFQKICLSENHSSIPEKCPKIKCLEKFQKIHIKFLREKRGRGVPGRYQGDPPGRHTTWWRGQPRGAPSYGVGHRWPSNHSLTCHFLLAPE